MVVTDAQLFPPSEMKVRITSWDGRDSIVELQREWTVDKVKIVAMDTFLRPADSMKTSLYHKLLHVRLCKTLNEELTLLQEGVRENDELLLLKRRLPPSAFETAEKQKEDRRAPDMSTIRKMTAHLPKVVYNVNDEEPVNSVDFQTELRRILISLIEASQRILCLNPSAAKIFRQAEEMLSEPAPRPKIDEAALKQLTDMGFTEIRAKKALILNKMTVMTAMEWLLQNESDPDIDTPLPELDVPTSTPPTQEAVPQGAEGGAENEIPCFTNILDTIRAFKKREFRPHPRALQRLIEMGFQENEAVDALRMFRNDQDAACDWLLGDRRDCAAVIDEGLDPTSPVYKAIMDNPTVQLGLNNPRCLLAFLQMLENPMAANQWLSDPETGPILMQISRIYQMRLEGERVASTSASSPTWSATVTTTTATLPNQCEAVPATSLPITTLSPTSSALLLPSTSRSNTVLARGTSARGLPLSSSVPSPSSSPSSNSTSTKPSSSYGSR